MSELDIKKWQLSQTEELIKSFSSALRNRTMYPAGHPIVLDSFFRLARNFTTYWMRDFEEWTIVLIGGEFVFEKVPLPKVSAVVRPLFKIIASRRIESLTINKGVTAEELSEFVSLMVSEETLWQEHGNVLAAMSSKGIKNIAFQFVELDLGTDNVSTDTDEARDIYTSLKGVLAHFFLSLFDPRRTPALDVIFVLRDRTMVALDEDFFSIVSRLHTRHDPDDLITHSLNTAIMSYVTAQAMEFSIETCADIFIAGLLHDIGITDIPPNYKDGVLHRSKNRQVYLEHPVRGMGMLRTIPSAPTLAEVVAFEHHQKWNGRGFPQVKGKKKMHPASGIVAVASTYDNLMHGAERLPPEEIPPRLIRLAGIDFEPTVVAHFLAAIGVYPPGTYVKLTTDEIGLVVKSTRKDIFRPTVKLLFDSGGGEYVEEKTIDLTDRNPATGTFFASIDRSVLPEELDL